MPDYWIVIDDGEEVIWEGVQEDGRRNSCSYDPDHPMVRVTASGMSLVEPCNECPTCLVRLACENSLFVRTINLGNYAGDYLLRSHWNGLTPGDLSLLRADERKRVVETWWFRPSECKWFRPLTESPVQGNFITHAGFGRLTWTQGEYIRRNWFRGNIGYRRVEHAPELTVVSSY